MKKKTPFWARLILAAGLALALFAPAGAQGTEPAGDSQKPVVNTYNKQPDPTGKNQDFKAQTYNKAPDPQGDDQKLDAKTYTEKPPAQYDTSTKTKDDVSKLENDVVPTYESPPVPPTATTYDKVPDPTGVNQKLDAVRYEQENRANNGKESKLEMQVLEGSVKE